MKKVMSMTKAMGISNNLIKSAGNHEVSIIDVDTGERRYYKFRPDESPRRKLRNLRALHSLYLVYGGASVKNADFSHSLAQPGSLKEIVRWLIEDVERVY